MAEALGLLRGLTATDWSSSMKTEARSHRQLVRSFERVDGSAVGGVLRDSSKLACSATNTSLRSIRRNSAVMIS